MKKLMITAAASALIMGAAACSNDDDVAMNDTTYGQENAEMAEMDETSMDDSMEAETAEVETVYLTSGDLSAGELVGAEVLGIDGEKIATVDDLLIGDDGMVEMVVFRSGDFIDLVGTKGALPYSELDLAMTDDNEPGFTVSMTEEAIQNVAEFDQDGFNDYRLASEMIGTTADFTNSDDSARINDIIVSTSGEARYAIVGNPVMGEDRQIGFDLIMVEQGTDGEDDVIMIDASGDDLQMMPIFEYERDEMDTTDSERDAMTDWDSEDADNGEMDNTQ